MCQSLAEGGQRCSTHTGARLQQKAAAVRAAAEAGDRGAFFAAQVEWEEAAVEFASTPKGAEVLTAERGAAQDAHTVALLDSVLRRGESLREANNEIRAVLRVAAVTEAIPTSAVPEPAIDENDHALSAEDTAQLHRVMQRLAEEQEQAREERLDNPTAVSEYEIQQIRDKSEAFAKADTTIASAASTTRDLTCAVGDLVAYAATEEETAVAQAQVRRALNHPNAGTETFFYAKNLPLGERIAHPHSPDAFVFDTLRATPQAQLTPEEWSVVEQRGNVSPLIGAGLAVRHPDEYKREGYQIAALSTQWDTVSEADAASIASVVGSLPVSNEAKTMCLTSLMRYAPYYSEDAQRRILVNAQALYIPELTNSPEFVSLGHRLNKAEAPGLAGAR